MIPITEDTLTTLLRGLLTESYLRETLESHSDCDDNGRPYTDLSGAAASMADWLAQELAEKLSDSQPDSQGNLSDHVAEPVGDGTGVR